MELKPATPWEWIPIVRRTRYTQRDTLLFALLLATYADPDGTRVFPGVKRLMNVTGRSRATVGRCLAELRTMGLIELVPEGSSRRQKEGSDEYRLTYPDDIFGRIPMIDPDAQLSTATSQW